MKVGAWIVPSELEEEIAIQRMILICPVDKLPLDEEDKMKSDDQVRF